MCGIKKNIFGSAALILKQTNDQKNPLDPEPDNITGVRCYMQKLFQRTCRYFRTKTVNLFLKEIANRQKVGK